MLLGPRVLSYVQRNNFFKIFKKFLKLSKCSRLSKISRFSRNVQDLKILKVLIVLIEFQILKILKYSWKSWKYWKKCFVGHVWGYCFGPILSECLVDILKYRRKTFAIFPKGYFEILSRHPDKSFTYWSCTLSIVTGCGHVKGCCFAKKVTCLQTVLTAPLCRWGAKTVPLGAPNYGQPNSSPGGAVSAPLFFFR